MMISVFTPTYNRADTLHRVYDSIAKQTIQDIEWIVVDDGSTDNTEDVINEFKKKSKFPIRYIKQSNNGKHIAFNRAVEVAQGEFFATVDSDDDFVSNAFEVMLKYWNAISLESQNKFKGVTCRCYDPETGKTLGPIYKDPILDVSELDAKFIYGFRFDLWGISRTEVLKKYKYPEILGGQKSGLRYYPETIYWNNLSRHYLTRYINEALCGYYKDQDNALTGKTIRAKENRYLWLHYINDVNDYFKYYPMLFIKACVGLARDSYILSGSSGVKEATAIIKTKRMKCLYSVLSVPGVFLGKRYLNDKKQRGIKESN